MAPASPLPPELIAVFVLMGVFMGGPAVFFGIYGIYKAVKRARKPDTGLDLTHPDGIDLVELGRSARTTPTVRGGRPSVYNSLHGHTSRHNSIQAPNRANYDTNSPPNGVLRMGPLIHEEEPVSIPECHMPFRKANARSDLGDEQPVRSRPPEML